MGSMKSANEESLAARLKEVFEIVDEQKNGFISLDHFLELAKEFTSSNGHNNNAKRRLGWVTKNVTIEVDACQTDDALSMCFLVVWFIESGIMTVARTWGR
ncbi:hypothetical protein HELRODRAFT_165319 [Helobdella robusta]|uniref:EF-hand domain-containing protein n=1 Tax=Helobdella robusta TaxID=6412 RepID=T1EWL2_HELRO|nr:hypothetical protein HELRODRAFT_165319 [Helobdella robusta]ESN91309.1 hypothetical protein HELRODRAFT_165319 [Helobdella robusta]